MKPQESKDAYVIQGKLALPYTYFAGRTGSFFLTQIRDHRAVKGVKCPDCKKVYVPPRQTCHLCMADISDNWVDLSGKGTVVNHTVVNYQDRHLPRTPPYILAMILLEGTDTPLVHILEEIDPDQEIQGMEVEPVFSDKTTATILDIDHFKPTNLQP
ncbi:MAG: Zn-ribbon domain-containing OB-fold protein [Desulfobacter sp.]|nr:MAG: Zn-ribbon domain-containing OB-fold protein [Desulfobacter sp.]